jgi:hypothetical protein
MSIISTEQLISFISNNHLKKDDGIVCFNAQVEFFDPAINIISEIQVISLPCEQALYVIDYDESMLPGADVYSTSKFCFFHHPVGHLEIAGNDGKKVVLISVIPQ